VPALVLYESFLSFLGLGIRPPQASLGSLIADGASQLNPVRVRWWLLVFLAGLMALLLAALNGVGEGLRSALEPREGDGRSD
jgi:ABC-type dipeptide/oligopeptide/nickel transport system permease subunit